ncbi:unnamed protein product, partial [Amoebophrya sp. A120]
STWTAEAISSKEDDQLYPRKAFCFLTLLKMNFWKVVHLNISCIYFANHFFLAQFLRGGCAGA